MSAAPDKIIDSLDVPARIDSSYICELRVELLYKGSSTMYLSNGLDCSPNVIVKLLITFAASNSNELSSILLSRQMAPST